MSIESDVELKALGGKTSQKIISPEAPKNPSEKTETLASTESATEVSETHDPVETSEASDPSKGDEIETEESQERDQQGRPRKKGVEKRIDKLVKERAQAREEAIQLKARLEVLERQVVGKSSDKEVDAKPPSDGKPRPDDFTDHEKYLDARDDWNRKQWKAEESQKELRERSTKKIETYKERAKEFAKTHPDWEEITSEVSDVQLSMTVYTELVESENGPELYYELSKNPDELKRINLLSPSAASREIGKFEAGLSLKESSENKETKRLTKAPKPISPVGSKSSSTKSIYDRDLSQHEFEKLRVEQIKQNGMRN